MKESLMPNFQRGDRVEVLCTDEGFKGAYYPATIVAKIDAGEYLIQYDTLLREDELAPLREMVSPAALRPMPPEIPAGKFAVRGKVDVFANDGWWVGKVIKRLPGRGRTYLVFFESNGEVGKYRPRDLRVHQDWVDGKWSTCFKEL